MPQPRGPTMTSANMSHSLPPGKLPASANRQPSRGVRVVTDRSELGLARQISDGFALGSPRRMVSGAQGAMGRVWRLETETGSFAVKESLLAEDRSSLEIQLEFAAAVSERAQRAGVVVPRALRSRHGPFLFSVHDENAADPRHVRVATWIEGRPEVDTSSAAGWLGATLAAIETLPNPPPVPPRDPWMQAWFSQVPTIEQWSELAERAARTAAPWASALVKRLPDFTDLNALVGPPQPDRLTVAHTDLQPKNVVTTATGFALLDWDDAAAASRDRVLARAISDWHLRAGVIDLEAVRSTLTAYRAGGGTGTLHQTDAFSDLVAGFLNYLYEQAETTLTQPAARAGAWGTDHVMAMIANPVDMPTLHRLSSLEGPDGSFTPTPPRPSVDEGAP